MRRDAAGHTLGATALLHEAWFRLSEQTRTRWNDRGHFMAKASTMMRRILVDHALARRAAKRDAELQPISTTLLDHHGDGLDRDVVAVHDALLAFEAVDPRAAKVVELKSFGGLEVEEIAQALQPPAPPSNATGRWHVPGCGANWVAPIWPDQRRGSPRRLTLMLRPGASLICTRCSVPR